MANLSQQLADLIGADRTIAVAESLTGGRLQSLITATSGSSRYFLGGVTAYHLKQKERLLGVDAKHGDSVNSVSQRVALEMATGVRKMFGASIGVSTTGYAEPSPENQVDSPFAFYAIDIQGHTSSGHIDAGTRSRVDVQLFVAETVLSKVIASCATGAPR